MSTAPELDVFEIGGARVAELVGPPGATVASERDAVDLVGNAYFLGADYVLVAAERLVPEFFDLSSGLAGDVLQKFATYRVGLVVVGDHGREASESLAALQRESNRGGHVWFVKDREEALAWIAEGRRA